MAAILKALSQFVGVPLLILALCTACQEEPKRARQVAKISLLPDTPPPPPPPPPKEQPPPPKDQQKEVTQQARVDAPPQAETLKMEGPAGDAPSAFAAGTPTKEYTGQELGGNGQPSGSGGIGRAEFEIYRTRLQRILQDELARMKELKGVEYRTPVKVSRADSTQAWNVSFPDSTGDAQLDELLRNTLNKLIQKDPQPASAPTNGFSVRVTNKFLN